MKKATSLLLAAIVSTNTSCANMGKNETTSTLLGAAGGALVGSAFGRGEGRLIGAGIGAVAGGLIGNTVGKDMDKKRNR